MANDVLVQVRTDLLRSLLSAAVPASIEQSGNVIALDGVAVLPAVGPADPTVPASANTLVFDLSVWGRVADLFVPWAFAPFAVTIRVCVVGQNASSAPSAPRFPIPPVGDGGDYRFLAARVLALGPEPFSVDFGEMGRLTLQGLGAALSASAPSGNAVQHVLWMLVKHATGGTVTNFAAWRAELNQALATLGASGGSAGAGLAAQAASAAVAIEAVRSISAALGAPLQAAVNTGVSVIVQQALQSRLDLVAAAQGPILDADAPLGLRSLTETFDSAGGTLVEARLESSPGVGKGAPLQEPMSFRLFAADLRFVVSPRAVARALSGQGMTAEVLLGFLGNLGSPGVFGAPPYYADAVLAVDLQPGVTLRVIDTIALKLRLALDTDMNAGGRIRCRLWPAGLALGSLSVELETLSLLLAVGEVFLPSNTQAGLIPKDAEPLLELLLPGGVPPASEAVAAFKSALALLAAAVEELLNLTLGTDEPGFKRLQALAQALDALPSDTASSLPKLAAVIQSSLSSSSRAAALLALVLRGLGASPSVAAVRSRAGRVAAFARAASHFSGQVAITTAGIELALRRRPESPLSEQRVPINIDTIGLQLRTTLTSTNSLFAVEKGAAPTPGTWDPTLPGPSPTIRRLTVAARRVTAEAKIAGALPLTIPGAAQPLLLPQVLWLSAREAIASEPPTAASVDADPLSALAPLGTSVQLDVEPAPTAIGGAHDWADAWKPALSPPGPEPDALPGAVWNIEAIAAISAPLRGAIEALHKGAMALDALAAATDRATLAWSPRPLPTPGQIASVAAATPAKAWQAKAQTSVALLESSVTMVAESLAKADPAGKGYLPPPDPFSRAPKWGEDVPPPQGFTEVSDSAWGATSARSTPATHPAPAPQPFSRKP
jgi:hypothetical protein